MPFADLPGGKLYYEDHGKGEPLLLHPGFGCTVEIYWRNTLELAQHFRVVVFDPRGAGRSAPAPPGMTMQDLAHDAAALLDELSIASAHVFGTSFGGMVAQHIALEHPARVNKLVLGCTTAGGASHVRPPAENMAAFMAASGITDPAAAMRSTYPINYSEAFTARWDDVLARRALANEPLRSTPEGRAAQLHAVQHHDTVNRLGDIAHQTLVAHAPDDGTVPVENGRLLAERIPNATLKLYPPGRHLFFTECAESLNRDIVDFLHAPHHAGAK